MINEAEKKYIYPRSKNTSITIFGYVGINGIKKLTKELEGKNPNIESLTQCMEKIWDIQQKLLENGGFISNNAKVIRIIHHPDYAEGNFIDEKEYGIFIRKGQDNTLGYRFDIVKGQNLPVFFSIENNTEILFEPIQKRLTKLAEKIMSEEKIGYPRFSSFTVTTQNLMSISRNKGIGYLGNIK